MPSKSPDAFRTISEVADWLQTPAHVLRFWESKFSQVKPVKRAGGRRYYRPADMALIGGIKKLLHDDGMTIKGVQKVLREQGIKYVSALSPPLDEDLEAMIESATAPEPARPPAPETGRVLEFASRPEPKPAATGDLFGEEDDAGKAEAPPVADADAPDTPEVAEPVAETPPEPTAEEATEDMAASPEVPEDADLASTSEAEDLPDFVQKPMSERLAEDVAASPAEPEPAVDDAADVSDHAETTAVGLTPAEAPPVDLDTIADTELEQDVPGEEATVAKDAPEHEVRAEKATVDETPDVEEPVADTTPVEDVTVEKTAEAETPPTETVATDAPAPVPDEVAEDTPPEPEVAAEVLDAPDAAKVPPDPLDRESEAPAGILTLLTSQEMRGIRHSAERIETLIIRVRNHHRAMNHASRR